MTRQRYFVTCAMAFAVAGLPFLFVEEMTAAAQERTSNGNTTGSAVPRGGGDGGGSAVPAGGGGGGSSAGSGSSGGGGSVGSVDASGHVSPPSPAWSSVEAPRRSDDQGSRSRGGGASTGTASPRSGSGGSGGGSTRGGGSNASGRSASSDSSESGAPRRAVPAYSRPRDGRPVTGEVTERGSVPGGGGGGGWYPSYPYYPYYPWGFWGPGYGFGLGYLYYDPWFSSYGYGYGDPGYYAGGGSGGYSVSQSYRENGSLRLKINPKQAEIFVDGYYVGVVDSFDGAFQKLGLEGGSHKIELKAEGYEPAEFEVLITPGETVTYKGESEANQVSQRGTARGRFTCSLSSQEFQASTIFS